MNAPLPIIATHFGTTDEDLRDLAFARLAALSEDVGGSLADIARLCGRPQIAEVLLGLEGLHRGPSIADEDIIREVIPMLERLRDELMAIPADCEIRTVILEKDRPLVADLDAAVRYAGARVDDNIAGLRSLVD